MACGWISAPGDASAGRAGEPPEQVAERQRADDQVAQDHVEQQLLVGPLRLFRRQGQVCCAGMRDQLAEVLICARSALTACSSAA
jgi:hypothetical protein